MIRVLLALVLSVSVLPAIAVAQDPPQSAEEYRRGLEQEIETLRADTEFRLEYIVVLVNLLNEGINGTPIPYEIWMQFEWLIMLNKVIILDNSARIAQLQAAKTCALDLRSPLLAPA